MEAHATLFLIMALVAYIILVYAAVRLSDNDEKDTIRDSESRWMLDDFYLPKE